MANYEEAIAKLTNTLLNKLESVAKHKHLTSLYIFILLFLTFSKERFVHEIKKILPTCLTQDITRKKMIKRSQ